MADDGRSAALERGAERSEPLRVVAPDPTLAAHRARFDAERARRHIEGKMAAVSRPTSLLTEQLHDGEANCLERATRYARTGRDDVVFMRDRTDADGDDAGHALIRNGATGRVWDPNDGPPPKDPTLWTYANVDAWTAGEGVAADGQPRYAIDASIPAERVERVLNLPPVARANDIEQTGDPELAKVMDRMYAAPDRPGDEASDHTMGVLAEVEASGLPLETVLLRSPTLRPAEVERAALSGSLYRFDRHPGSSFVGAMGEALLIANVRQSDRTDTPIPSLAAVSQPGMADLGDWAEPLRPIIGRAQPDLATVQLGGEVGPLGQEVEWNNTIGPGTGGQPREINHGTNTVVALWEVTTSNRFDAVADRASKVAAWARGMRQLPEIDGVRPKAVLAIDEGVYRDLLRDRPRQMRALVDQVTGAGGYISLIPQLRETALENARIVADLIRQQ